MQKCTICGTEFYMNPAGNKKYCSHKCTRKAWKAKNREKCLELNREYYRKHKKKVIPKEKNCEYCNKIFLPLPQHPYQKYCDYVCRNAMFVKLNPEKIIEYRKTSRKRHKEKINKRDMEYHDKMRFGGNRVKTLERDRYRCQICNSEDQLVVHHKDFTGQDSNSNNELDNLITLCRSCHAKIHL